MNRRRIIQRHLALKKVIFTKETKDQIEEILFLNKAFSI